VDSELSVHVLDMGNADSILVTNQGINLLIDAGTKEKGPEVVRYLKDLKISRLDIIIATHPHTDHIGGMAEVLKKFEVGTLIMSFMPEGKTPTTSTYLNLLETIDARGLSITEAAPGQTYPLGEAVLEILGPAGEFEEENNQSVISRIIFGSQRFLFMGDAEKKAEKALMEQTRDLAADFIKIGHHGSGSSTHDAFIARVRPAYAAITCGAGNSYGHPKQEVLDRLKKLDTAYYRSDINGTTMFRSDGEIIEVTVGRGS
jgi:competence protein ComEC